MQSINSKTDYAEPIAYTECGRDMSAYISLPDMLRRALETASLSESFIKPEQARIYTLLKSAKSDTEIKAREYQIEYMHQYLTRAATIAKKRLAHLSTLNTLHKIKQELDLIKSNIQYWFEMYAWGYDPRARTPLSIVPFDLFPTQKKLVDWLDEQVFNRRGSGLIEKARDEGATETIVRWGLYNWLFRNGFSMLFSTRKEDEVDSKKNQNTLFERIRYQIRLLPAWQLPDLFSPVKDMSADMLIANPVNGNTLLGEAPVENMGRGGRVTCAMLDEFAFWKFSGYPQFRSLSQTTDSIIMPSSVAGRLNQYADIAYDNITPKFVMDWRDNPFKDKRWYDALPFGFISPKMSRTTIAQEVDRDYDAAQPGKVWKVKEELVFMTHSEFLKPFKEKNLAHRFYDNTGKFKIPDDWRVMRFSDYGKSEGHDWSYLMSASPTKFYPCSDTQFVFVARNLEPTGLTTEQAVKLWKEYERIFGLRSINGEFTHKPYASYNSHEQAELRKVLLKRYGENWVAWKTDYVLGIETLQDWFTPVDVEKPNPFRPDLTGRCRLVFVAPDSEYTLAYNERLSTHFVTMSESEEGFLTCRKQISAYHYPETELGKSVKLMRPVKEFDDIVDSLRALGVMWNKQPQQSTDSDHIEQTLPEGLTVEAIDEIEDDNQKSLTLQRRLAKIQEIERAKTKTVLPAGLARRAKR